ncbi:hypothetical protein [Afifella pfennigii]|uniref:hypothetical protein n=1 Tax=Afifella pfennigii TaxID=209897 RepID=UPI00068F3408|nr:hypothetical protein [Afifella pfennigii]
MNALARVLPAFEAEPVEPPTLAAVFRAHKSEEDDERLKKAEAEGYARGLAQARAEIDAALEKARRQEDIRLGEARSRWAEEEGARLGEVMQTAIAEMQAALSQAAAGVLLPLAEKALAERAAEDLAKAIAVLLAQEGEKLVRLTGPKDLLEAVGRRLGEQAGAIEFKTSKTPDARLVAGSTVMETQLQAWGARLSEAAGEVEDG